MTREQRLERRVDDLEARLEHHLSARPVNAKTVAEFMRIVEVDDTPLKIEFVRAAHATKALCCSRPTVSNLIAAGKLEAIRLESVGVLVTVASIEAYLKNKSTRMPAAQGISVTA